MTVDPGDLSSAELAEKLHWEMFRIASAIRRREYADSSDSELSLTQCSILYTLRQHGRQRLTDLAAHEGVRAPTMAKAIGRLELLGFVKRERDVADKRNHWVEATPLGKSAQREAVAQTVDGMQAMLSEDELQALRVAMKPLGLLADVLEGAVPQPTR